MLPWYKSILNRLVWRWIAVIAMGFTVAWGQAMPSAMASPQISAPIVSAMADAAVSPSALDSTLNQFLQHIPPGYYGIRDVNLLKTQLKETDTVLIDVREPSEYFAGHIDSAINIPLRTLAQNLDQIPKDQPVVLYCSSGYRTGMGVMTLQLLGYDKVQGFPPSYQGWQRAQ